MNSPEINKECMDYFLPDNIEDVLANDLIPSGYPGGATKKYHVRGYPDLLVRKNVGGNDLEHIQHAAAVFNELPDYGIDVLPYLPVEVEGEPHIVTLNVTGESLEDAVNNGHAREIASRVDMLWANLATYLLTCKREGKPYAGDIYHPRQYMYGTVARDPTARIWLVDLGEYAHTFRDYVSYYQYEGEVLKLVNTVALLEGDLREQLWRSRLALEKSLDIIDVPELIEAAQNTLTTGVPMDLPGDLLED